MSQTQFVIAVFTDENAAGAALLQLQSAHQTDADVLESAVVRREDDGRITIKEQGDIGAGTGAVAGGLLGSIVGMLTGHTLAGAGIGALAGGAGAARLDRGIPDSRLKEIAAGLAYGSSAVAAVVSETGLPAAATLLEQSGGRVTTEPITLLPPTIDIPDTGNKGFDEWADRAAAKVAEVAGQAEKALGGLAARAEDSIQTAVDRAKGPPPVKPE